MGKVLFEQNTFERSGILPVVKSGRAAVIGSCSRGRKFPTSGIWFQN